VALLGGAQEQKLLLNADDPMVAHISRDIVDVSVYEGGGKFRSLNLTRERMSEYLSGEQGL